MQKKMHLEDIWLVAHGVPQGTGLSMPPVSDHLQTQSTLKGDAPATLAEPFPTAPRNSSPYRSEPHWASAKTSVRRWDKG